MGKNIEQQIIDISIDLLLPNRTADYSQWTSWTEQEWNKALAFAARHGLLAIVGSGLNSLNISDTIAKKIAIRWYGQAENSHKKFHARVQMMEALARLFHKHGIDILFLKGATLAQMYPIAEWRMFSDIDYYLYGHSDEGIEVLKHVGIETNEYAHHHTQAAYKGILLENHYDFFDRVNHRCNILLDDEMKRLAETEGKTMPFSFGEGTAIANAFSMTPTMNAIFLMRHMSAHFVSETIPLRMLFDWVLFLTHQAKAVDWNNVLHLYEQSDMLRFAECIQEIIEQKLHIKTAACPIKAKDYGYANRIWDSILSIEKRNPYKKNGFRYTLYETRIFFSNRWKHQLVYPKESFVGLFFSLLGLTVKRELGLLKH